jgi:hypothetical protein
VWGDLKVDPKEAQSITKGKHSEDVEVSFSEKIIEAYNRFYNSVSEDSQWFILTIRS